MPDSHHRGLVSEVKGLVLHLSFLPDIVLIDPSSHAIACVVGHWFLPGGPIFNPRVVHVRFMAVRVA